MKKIILVAVLLLIPITTNTQVGISCGSGVFIRPDGTVIIDSWKTYETPITTMMTPVQPAAKINPSSITIGKSIPDSTKICFENENGSNCLTLDKLRSIK